MSIQGKTIVLGVCGGIAAYKAAMICSQLKQRGAEIRVIMTEAATKFVQPLTFQTLSRHHVYLDTFEERDPEGVAHIDLADHADLFLIAPATANLIAKLAHGLADDMLSTTLLATRAPIWLAPAMNGHMLAHPAVQANLNLLKERGVHVLASGEGMLACGYVGQGRLLEPELIIEQVEHYFANQKVNSDPIREDMHTHSFWQGKKVLITAGPTQEAIDPVRYISNYSSGKMGYALAEMASLYGAQVTLVSGPVQLEPPDQVELVRVKSSEEMYQAVLARYAQMDVVIKAAAVADYRPKQPAQQKIKKEEQDLVLHLEKTTDILQELGKQKQGQILIGFAAETNDLEHYALEKIKRKNLDFIVANNVTEEGAGFGTDTNIVTIISKTGQKTQLPLLSKKEVAQKILQTVAESYV